MDMVSAGTTVLLLFFSIWAYFARFGSLRDWTFEEVALFYGVACAGFAITEWLGRGFDLFSSYIRQGEFDRILLRPRSTFLQMAGVQFDLRRMGELGCALTVLGWAIFRADIAWTVGKGLLLVCAVLGNACLFYGVFVLQATIIFWTVQDVEVLNVLTYGGREAGTFPLTIYSNWFRRLFTYALPVACVTYFPLVAILDKQDPLGTSRLWQYASPWVGLLFLLVTVEVWKVGVRHYRSTGT